MADGAYRFQQGTGQFFFNQHARNLPHRTGSPINNSRIQGFADTPSPTRSPGPQSPAHNPYGMFGQGHPSQAQHAVLNGNSHQRYAMQMNIAKPFQHQTHQNHSHQHQQHQDHVTGSHGATFGNHQHTMSSGGLSNATPHFGATHLQNGTPGSAHSALSKAPTEHWALQLQMAQQAREMTMSHAHARNHPGVSKSVVGGNTNGMLKDSEDKERNRAMTDGADDGGKKEVWTSLDFGGQNLKVIAPALFNYTFLTKLYLNSNKLKYLPPAIGQLRSLVHLDLSLNELISLPPEVGMLVKLKQLLLFDNHLARLPYELGSLCNLEMLGIEGNPLADDVKTIVAENGVKDLILHFRENAPEPPPPMDRSWAVLDETPVPARDKLTVLSYNTLGPYYATPTQYGYTPKHVLEWDYRKELIIQELRERHADIVCLQEVDQENFDEFFRPALAHNDYKGLFYPKSRARTMAPKDAKLVDGCATFWNNSKFVLLDKETVDFANIAINRQDMKGEHDIFNRVMPKDNVAMIIFLENRETGARLMVVNVHVYWDPAFKDVKLVQVAILMERISDISEKWAKRGPCTDKKVHQFTNGDGDGQSTPSEPLPEPGPSQSYGSGTDIPIIMCGDFNSTPGSGVYDLINQGTLSNQHSDLGNWKYGKFTRDGMAHPFNLKSSYSQIGELSFTNYTPGFTGVIDYIWYSTNTLQVTGLLGDVDQEYMKRIPGFPNHHFPSDHLALLAEFVVKGRKEKKVVEADFGPQRERRT